MDRVLLYSLISFQQVWPEGRRNTVACKGRNDVQYVQAMAYVRMDLLFNQLDNEWWSLTGQTDRYNRRQEGVNERAHLSNERDSALSYSLGLGLIRSRRDRSASVRRDTRPGTTTRHIF